MTKIMETQKKQRKQTRRSISLSGVTHQRLKDHCEQVGVSASSYVEHLVTKRLDELHIPSPTVLRPRKWEIKAAQEAAQKAAQEAGESEIESGINSQSQDANPK